MAKLKFFELFRKNGFWLTLDILKNASNSELKECDFFSELRKGDSYLNDFYRNKDEMLKYGLIAYKLDENYDKVLFLTQKGGQLYNKILEAEELLNTKVSDLKHKL